MKLLGHIIFESQNIDNLTIKFVYEQINKIAFDQAVPKINTIENQQSTNISSSQSQSSFYKTQRLALNVIANLLAKNSPYMKQNIELIFLKLKGVFEYQMRKIQQHFKSKRYISTLTTVIRALQLSMSENPKLGSINDSECVKLFIDFYKLLFLGSPFAEKMLNIKIEDPKQKKKTAKKQNDFPDGWDSEELKGDNDSFIIDTSDFSSDGSYSNEKKANQGSPSSNDSITSSDPYAKVKSYSSLCLQNLFKTNNKALFNYWYLLFPAFFMKPQSEFTPLIGNFKENQALYFQKLAQQVIREPTFFYLLKSKENNSKLKCTICFTIGILLENSIIQKWQGQLEKEDQYSPNQPQSSFISMSNVLGQFLRLLHYQILFMISEEKDPHLLSQLIKTLGTLLHITPYGKMNKGLASLAVQKLIELNSQYKSGFKETDNLVKASITNSLSIAFFLPDIIQEIDQNFFSGSQNQFLGIAFQNSQKTDQQLPIEHLTMIQRLCKNYGNRIYEAYDILVHDFFVGLLKSYDRKKMISCMNIIEEWIKSQKYNSIAEEIDDEDLEEVKDSEIIVNSTMSPFNLDKFKQLLVYIVDKILLSKQNPLSDVNIAILSMLCIIDQDPWKQVFSSGNHTEKIINFIEHIKQPPLLKAASLKLLGYLVYFKFLNEEQSFLKNIYSLVFESASETNINIQTRNSWTLANLTYINGKTSDQYVLKETLIASINYSMSNKEKITSNGIRSLGYLLMNQNSEKIREISSKDINKREQKKQITVESILKIIIDNIDNKNPKIAWNSCVALSNILDNDTLQKQDILFQDRTIKTLLSILISKPNFKTKIHACQTLMKFINFMVLGEKQIIIKFWEAMLNSLESLNALSAVNSNDSKYLKQLEINVLALWEKLSNLNYSDDENKIYDKALGEFINLNSLAVLQIISDYLRRELQIPLYSEMFDLDNFKEETLQLFTENLQLEPKLLKIQRVIIRIRNTINHNEEVHVSFGVFEGINSLANTYVKEYRILEVLKGAKSSFQPSFEDS